MRCEGGRQKKCREGGEEMGKGGGGVGSSAYVVDHERDENVVVRPVKTRYEVCAFSGNIDSTRGVYASRMFVAPRA